MLNAGSQRGGSGSAVSSQADVVDGATCSDPAGVVSFFLRPSSSSDVGQPAPSPVLLVTCFHVVVDFRYSTLGAVERDETDRMDELHNSGELTDCEWRLHRLQVQYRHWVACERPERLLRSPCGKPNAPPLQTTSEPVSFPIPAVSSAVGGGAASGPEAAEGGGGWRSQPLWRVLRGCFGNVQLAGEAAATFVDAVLAMADGTPELPTGPAFWTGSAAKLEQQLRDMRQAKPNSDFEGFYLRPRAPHVVPQLIRSWHWTQLRNDRPSSSASPFSGLLRTVAASRAKLSAPSMLAGDSGALLVVRSTSTGPFLPVGVYVAGGVSEEGSGKGKRKEHFALAAPVTHLLRWVGAQFSAVQSPTFDMFHHLAAALGHTDAEWDGLVDRERSHSTNTPLRTSATSSSSSSSTAIGSPFTQDLPISRTSPTHSPSSNSPSPAESPPPSQHPPELSHWHRGAQSLPLSSLSSRALDLTQPRAQPQPAPGVNDSLTIRSSDSPEDVCRFLRDRPVKTVATLRLMHVETRRAHTMNLSDTAADADCDFDRQVADALVQFIHNQPGLMQATLHCSLPGAGCKAVLRALAGLDQLRMLRFAAGWALHLELDVVKAVVFSNRSLEELKLDQPCTLGMALKSKLLPGLAALDDEELLAYLSSLRQGTVRYRMKLMLVGWVEAGKTSLMRALRKRPDMPFNEKHVPTQGIDVAEDVLELQGEGHQVQFQYWDFAGEKAYYATHQLFLSGNRTLYLLVWKPYGFDPRSSIMYWLRSVQSSANDAIIFIVRTHKDLKHGDRQFEASDLDEKDIRSRFPTLTLRFFDVSSKPTFERLGIDRLREAIVAQCKDMGRADLPASWASFVTDIERRARDITQTLRSETTAREAVTSKYQQSGLPLTPLVPATQLREWAKRCKPQVPEAEQEAAMLLLHNWGIILRFTLGTKGRVDVCVLDPHWLSEVARVLVTAKSDRIRNAMVPYAELRKLWADQVPESDMDSMLHLMHRFELSFGLKSNIEVVPALLKDEPDPEARDLLDTLFNRKQNESGEPLLLRLCRFELRHVPDPAKRHLLAQAPMSPDFNRFVPANLMPRLIFRTHKFTVKHGAAVHSCWRDFFVVQKDGQMANLYREDNTIHIRVIGTSPNSLCSMLSDVVLEVVKEYAGMVALQSIACPHCQRLFFPVEHGLLDSDGVTCMRCRQPIAFADVVQYIGFTLPELFSQMSVSDMRPSPLSPRASSTSQSSAALSSLAHSDAADAARAGSAQPVALLEQMYQQFKLTRAGKPPFSAQMLEQMQRSALNFLQAVHDLGRWSSGETAMKWLSKPSTRQHLPRMLYIVPPLKPSGLSLVRSLFESGQLHSTVAVHVHLLCEFPGEVHRLEDQRPYMTQLSSTTVEALVPVLAMVLAVAQAALSSAHHQTTDEKLDWHNDWLDQAVASLDERVRQPGAQVSGLNFDTLQKYTAWLQGLDPARGYQHLNQVALPSGEVCWVCDEHAKRVRSAHVYQDESYATPPAHPAPLADQERRTKRRRGGAEGEPRPRRQGRKQSIGAHVRRQRC